DEERGALARPAVDRDLAAVLLEDAVGDRQAETGPGPDLFRREERVEDALLELGRDPGPRVREGDPDQLVVAARGDPDRLALRIGERVSGVCEQVDEDLLELNRIGDDKQLVGAELELDLDPAEAELLMHEHQ